MNLVTARTMEAWNDGTAVEIAKWINLAGQHARLCQRLGTVSEFAEWMPWMDAAYFLLSFAPHDIRLKLFTGTNADRDLIVRFALENRGFITSDGNFYEL